MTSRLFHLTFDDPDTDEAKAFGRHLQELLSLNKADLDLCLAALEEMELVRTASQEKDVLDRLSSECIGERSTVVHALSVLNFFANGLMSEEIPDDDHQHWADDLISRDSLKREQGDSFQGILQRIIHDFLPSLQAIYEERRTAGGVLPFLKSVDYTVELRPVRKDRYHFGIDVDKYQPQILRTVQIASIHIGVDVGSVTDIYFQVDEVHLDNMISSLKAAKKEMSAFRQFLGFDDETGNESNA